MDILFPIVYSIARILFDTKWISIFCSLTFFVLFHIDLKLTIILFLEYFFLDILWSQILENKIKHEIWLHHFAVSCILITGDKVAEPLIFMELTTPFINVALLGQKYKNFEVAEFALVVAMFLWVPFRLILPSIVLFEFIQKQSFLGQFGGSLLLFLQCYWFVQILHKAYAHAQKSQPNDSKDDTFLKSKATEQGLTDTNQENQQQRTCP